MISAAAYGLAALIVLAIITWAISYVKHDVSIVDSAWSLMILLAAGVYALTLDGSAPRVLPVLVLVAVWAARLAIYITARNWGEPEDRRYQAIRARNQPHFEWKSLYLVFVLQALLAWLVSISLLSAINSTKPWGWLDTAGALVVAFAVVFESVADWQLSRFKADAANQGRVMNCGLWRYTRHPNYFGEFCVWWGFFLIALAAGGGWSVLSPLLMSVLLLKVSGVTLLEQDIGERRPAYRDYIARTNAFFPGLPKS